MRRYLIIMEPTETGWSAHVPDLHGCISTGRTRQEAETNIREAADFHVAGLLHEELALPEPRTEYSHVYIGR